MLGYSKFFMSLAILTTNVLAALLTFFVAKLAKNKWADIAISCANCITAGLFSGVIFLLQLPEIPHAEKDFFEKFKVAVRIPIGSIFIVFGVFLVTIIELMTSKLGGGHTHGHSHRHEHSADRSIRMRSSEEEDVEGDSEEAHQEVRISVVKYATFAILMAIHSLMEGIPLGLKEEQEDLAAYFWPLFLHKMLEAVSVAFAGLYEKTTFALLGSFIHASMTPVGTALGYTLVSVEGSMATDLSILLLMGLSTGFLVNITFVEIIATEMRNPSTSQILKIVLMFFGFAVTTIIAVCITFLE